MSRVKTKTHYGSGKDILFEGICEHCNQPQRLQTDATLYTVNKIVIMISNSQQNLYSESNLFLGSITSICNILSNSNAKENWLLAD